jgi:hypothetical protein
MADRVIEQRVAIGQAYHNDKVIHPAVSRRVFEPHKCVTQEDIGTLVDLTAVLNPFRHVTTELQSAGVTSSIALPAIMKIKGGLGPRGRLEVVKAAAGTDHPEEREVKEVSALDPNVQSVSYYARQDMDQRFVLDRLLPLAAAACLDPRVKVRGHQGREWDGARCIFGVLD